MTVGRTQQKVLDRTQQPRLAEEQCRAGQHEALEVLEMEWLSEMKRMDEGLAAAMEIDHATASANDVLTPGCDTEAETLRGAEQLAAHRQREARAAGSRQQHGSRPWSSASAASPAYCAGGGDGGATRAARSDAQQRGRRILMPWCAAARHREAQSGDEISRSGAEEMQQLSEDELVERQEGEPDAEKDRRWDQGDEEVARLCRGRTTQQQQQQQQQGGIHRQQDCHDCHSAVTVGVGQQADAAKQGVIEARTSNPE